MTAPTTRTEGAADGLREAVASAIQAATFAASPEGCNGMAPDSCRYLADAAIAAVRAYDAAHPPLAPQPVPVVATGARCDEPGCSFGRVPAGDGLGYCPRCHPSAPAAQATVPDWDLAVDVQAAIDTWKPHVDGEEYVPLSHRIAAELTRLGYGLDGGLSAAARMTISRALHIMVGVGGRDELSDTDAARAEIEAMARVGVRT